MIIFNFIINPFLINKTQKANLTQYESRTNAKKKQYINMPLMQCDDIFHSYWKSNFQEFFNGSDLQ